MSENLPPGALPVQCLLRGGDLGTVEAIRLASLRVGVLGVAEGAHVVDARQPRARGANLPGPVSVALVVILSVNNPAVKAMNKTFLLGAGCQKGGTTWLQSYLADAPECAPGWGTEYHVFDSIDLPEHAWVLTGIAKRGRAAIASIAAGRLAASGKDLHRLAMIADPTFYYDYFTGLLAPADMRLAMDITPNYAMLSTERLSQIVEQFDHRGVRAVSLFLMRDPVERIWSHIRMQKQRRPRQHPQPDHVLLEQRYAQEPFTLRTRYEDTVRRLDAAFGAGLVHYDFYETVFDDDHLRALSGFLGLRHRPADIQCRLNASPKTTTVLPEGLVHRVVNHFRSTYEFVAERFSTDLEVIWPNVRYLD